MNTFGHSKSHSVSSESHSVSSESMSIKQFFFKLLANLLRRGCFRKKMPSVVVLHPSGGII